MDSSLLTRKYPQIINQKDSNDNSLYISFIVMIILFFNETSTVSLEVWLGIDHLPSMHGVLEIQINSVWRNGSMGKRACCESMGN